MKLGIVGGGQLGQMMALAGLPLGVQTVLLDPSEDSCGARAGQHICANYTDESSLQALANQCDAITFEFENVPPSAVEQLALARPAFPAANALETARDRWLEKSLFQTLGIATAKLALVDDQDSLAQAVDRIGVPCILKTRTMGYDGKGQKVIKRLSDVENTFSELGDVPCLLESFVDFEYEISCIGVRDQAGQCRFYPIVKNEHRSGILHKSEPIVRHALQDQAESATGAVMEALNYVGVMAFEFFVRGDTLVANEIAPRVHNSGHWTIEGSACSQFENHVRAVLGLPLGSTESTRPCIMLNVIGRRPDVKSLLSIPGVHWHDYGKAERTGRKVAHITVTADSSSALLARVEKLEALLVNELG